MPLVDVQARLEALPAGDARQIESGVIDGYTREALDDLESVEARLNEVRVLATELADRFGAARARVTARVEEELRKLAAAREES